MKDDYSKAIARVILLTNFRQKENIHIIKSGTDDLWFDTMTSAASNEVSTKGVEAQEALTVELEVLKKYEDVHRKMLEELRDYIQP
jgi:hypothetical protein